MTWQTYFIMNTKQRSKNITYIYSYSDKGIPLIVPVIMYHTEMV